MRVVLVAALLLLLATARPGAARARRESPAEGAEGAGTEDFLSRHFQTLSDLFTRDLPQRLRAEELRSQADTKHGGSAAPSRPGCVTSGGAAWRSPAMADAAARRAVAELPLLRAPAGPRDREGWAERLREEYRALIQYVENNKRADTDWFRLESNPEGTRWSGRCWYIHELLKYEFNIEFEIPVTYPGTAPEIAIPELDGKTAKMYRGGKICLSDHFKPLWARNVPKFGLAHLMALGLAPWLAVEIPDLISKGLIQHKDK